ncbi:MAG: decarboxylating NADP(+)-dependent phosphogluconate dehydrogenase [Planctomycetota bacterium]|jgi:6-phosphogluconate dehydrogenase
MLSSQATQADIGLIGLAVMGQNLVLNMNDKGFTVAVFNRTVSKVDDFTNGPAAGRDTIIGTKSLESFTAALQRPRRVMLMVKAGAPVDEFIDKLLPNLQSGDIIIDGGNSHFQDTIRRCKSVEAKGLRYIGTGISGGEQGARHGPSIMPGGTPDAWRHVADILQAIAAKANDGSPCCDWVGENGAGHFVKMVHNGIEYGDMQLICEAYALMKAAGLSTKEMQEVFVAWNRSELNSYLIEITAAILGKTDEQTGQPMVDVILDAAGQKGTGKWTGITALELGVPLTLISEAVFARCLSGMKERRVEASKVFRGPKPTFKIDRESFLEDLRKALFASKIISYVQGFELMRQAADEYDWNLNYGGIASTWRGGCIIRSQFLERIKDAYDKDKNLDALLVVPYFRSAVRKAQSAWRRTIIKAVKLGVPVPAFTSALAYYDGYRSAWLPANLLQAQRDYFGAHTYERVDKPRGEFFHTDWTGAGGPATAGSYTA